MASSQTDCHESPVAATTGSPSTSASEAPHALCEESCNEPAQPDASRCQGRDPRLRMFAILLELDTVSFPGKAATPTTSKTPDVEISIHYKDNKNKVF